eukprot:6191760-Pleurochrysis_carterae.AAC.2
MRVAHAPILRRSSQLARAIWSSTSGIGIADWIAMCRGYVGSEQVRVEPERGGGAVEEGGSGGESARERKRFPEREKMAGSIGCLGWTEKPRFSLQMAASTRRPC